MTRGRLRYLRLITSAAPWPVCVGSWFFLIGCPRCYGRTGLRCPICFGRGSTIEWKRGFARPGKRGQKR